MKKLEEYIRIVPDFPKPGVAFRDINSVLQDADGFRLCIDEMIKLLNGVEFDALVCAESRGFILGAPIAYELKKPLVMVRKKGKLPGETISQEYELEYGKAVLEIQKGAISEGERVVIVDDLVATGGTLMASVKLAEALGGKVAKIVCMMELAGFNGREVLKDYDLGCVITYEGK